MDVNVEFREIAAKVIREIDPTATEPDKLSKGKYRAPDFSLFGGKLLVELKSLNSEKSANDRLSDISLQQNRPMYVIGITSSENFIGQLPNPEKARGAFYNKTVRNLAQAIGDARDQFEKYEAEVPAENSSKVLIITDNCQDCELDTCVFEREIGKQMGGLPNFAARSGLIDAVVYLRHPSFVRYSGNSYWCKALQRSNANSHLFVDYFIRDFWNRVQVRMFPENDDLQSDKFQTLLV